jgi:hypothetical protein
VQVTNAYWFQRLDLWRSDTDCRQALDSYLNQRFANEAAVEHQNPGPLDAAEISALAVRWGLDGSGASALRRSS